MSQFIDQVQIEVASGDGGNGAVNWRREKYEPMGGPAGGNGGRGGSVILEATRDLSTLIDFRFRQLFEAPHGVKGGIKNRHGKAGQDLVIRVPVGTVVKDTQSGKIIADLTEDGQRALVAEGGRGGIGNTEMATASKRSPYFCEPGEPGVRRNLELTLKLLADVGIIGLPNAGKSTLLAAVTRAKPKIADYPFSTLEPNLGVAKLRPGESFVLADIPGLIEGASQGIGLGHNFLRHIERTRVLIHMVDGTAEDLEGEIKTIRKELSLYGRNLSQLPSLIAINKIESLAPEEAEALKDRVVRLLGKKGNEFEEALKLKAADRVFLISAVAHLGTDELIQKTSHLVERMKALTKDEITVVEPDEKAFDHGDSSFTVCRENGVFLVEGDRASRLVSVTNMKEPESLFSLFQRLRAMGVIDELISQGVEPGSEVVIGGFSFTYGEGM